MTGPTLYDYLLRNARHFGARKAVTFETSAASHAGLLSLADAVAGRMAVEGVARGDRVAIWLENGVDWIAIFLACSRLGAVAVPINTRLTPSELVQIIEISRASLLLASRHYRRRHYRDEALDALATRGVPCRVLEVSAGAMPVDWRIAGISRRDERSPPPLPDDCLAIHFTSGTSTGTPKGVLLGNDHFVRAAEYASRCLMMTPNTPFASGATFFHTSGTMHCISACLVSGATLHAMTAWDGLGFVDIVEREGCIVSHAPFFADIMSLPREMARRKLASLERTTAAGETPEALKRLASELDIPGLATLYGMTETCGNFTMWFPDDSLEKRTGANGRPAIGNEIRIVAPETGQALEPGAIGEIQMRGPGITKGYFENAAANREAFSADGWLRSGDSGTLSETGELSYLGRFKDIIRIGGENMTPVETEAVLLDTGCFGDVCVLAMPDARLTEIPVAVVIPKQTVENWETVILQARKRLADFKVPRQIFVADEFPRTEATRRVQRSVLRDWMTEGRLTRVL